MGSDEHILRRRSLELLASFKCLVHGPLLGRSCHKCKKPKPRPEPNHVTYRDAGAAYDLALRAAATASCLYDGYEALRVAKKALDCMAAIRVDDDKAAAETAAARHER